MKSRTVEEAIIPDSHQNCSEILGGQRDKVSSDVKDGPQSFLINLHSEMQESCLLFFCVEVSVVCN